MKQLIDKLCQIIALFMTILSCAPELDIQQAGFSSTTAEVTSWSEPYHILFQSTPGTATIMVNANQEWSVTPINDRADWCTISPAENKKGTTSIVLRVTENGYEEREAAYTFTCGKLNRTIIVTQKQKDALIISSSKIVAPESGGNYTIEVQHNIPYTVVIDDKSNSWIKISGGNTKGLSNNVFSIMVSENEDISKRSGRITVKNDKKDEDILIYQNGATPTLVISQDSFLVPASGGSVNIEIKSNVKYDYSIIEGADWIHETSTKSMSTHTLQFIIDINTSYDERVGIIRFLDKETGLEEYVTISQNQTDALMISQNRFEISDEENIITLEIKSNINYEYSVTEGTDWISEVGTKSLSSRTIQFLIKQNETYDERAGKIRFSEKSTGMEETVEIKQQGNDWSELSIITTAREVKTPVFWGTDIHGESDWGVGIKLNYDSTYIHKYSDNSEKRATFRIHGVETATLPTIAGLQHIDLTGFLKQYKEK